VAMRDVRQLTDKLRPAAVQEVGLVGAIRQRVANYNLPGNRGVFFSVDAPEHLPSLPAAVEEAAYLIAQEAIHNVVRHAHASTCSIRLSTDDADKYLKVEVTDDGRGLPKRQITSGLGLGSMRERAEELGGKFDIKEVPEGGTRVYARLPLNPTEEE
jgi:signal transduction histidine kinase